jgi:hypothetical protein
MLSWMNWKSFRFIASFSKSPCSMIARIAASGECGSLFTDCFASLHPTAKPAAKATLKK